MTDRETEKGRTLGFSNPATEHRGGYLIRRFDLGPYESITNFTEHSIFIDASPDVSPDTGIEIKPDGKYAASKKGITIYVWMQR